MKVKSQTFVRLCLVTALVGLNLLVTNGVTQAQRSHAGTIHLVLGTQGLGDEGNASKAQIQAFMKKYKNIKVTIDTHSANANNAYQAYITTFAGGSTTPDVINSDVIWPAGFAAAGFISSLDSYHPNRGAFFGGMTASGLYKGHLYALPWFINAEGLYYRKDLVGSAPKTAAQLVSKAKAGMGKGAKYGIVFEANKYEGLVTDYMNFLGGFGGSILNKNGSPTVNSPAAVKALTFMISLIRTHKVAPAAVTGWGEGDVQQAFLSGDAAMSVNWPYIFPLAQKTAALKNKVGWTTIPTSGGSPTATLGGAVLVMNAKSRNKAAAWKLMNFLSSKSQQIYRAKRAGDPPALKSAYGPALYNAAPYYRQEKAVYSHVVSRPVNPKYTQISSILQTQLSKAFSGQASPKAALNAAQSQIKKLLGK